MKSQDSYDEDDDDDDDNRWSIRLRRYKYNLVKPSPVHCIRHSMRCSILSESIGYIKRSGWKEEMDILKPAKVEEQKKKKKPEMWNWLDDGDDEDGFAVQEDEDENEEEKIQYEEEMNAFLEENEKDDVVLVDNEEDDMVVVEDSEGEEGVEEFVPPHSPVFDSTLSGSHVVAPFALEQSGDRCCALLPNHIGPCVLFSSNDMVQNAHLSTLDFLFFRSSSSSRVPNLKTKKKKRKRKVTSPIVRMKSSIVSKKRSPIVSKKKAPTVSKKKTLPPSSKLTKKRKKKKKTMLPVLERKTTTSPVPKKKKMVNKNKKTSPIIEHKSSPTIKHNKLPSPEATKNDVIVISDSESFDSKPQSVSSSSSSSSKSKRKIISSPPLTKNQPSNNNKTFLNVSQLRVGMRVSLLWNGNRWGAEIERVAPTRICVRSLFLSPHLIYVSTNSTHLFKQVHYDDGTLENIVTTDIASREISAVQQIVSVPSPDLPTPSGDDMLVGRSVEKYFETTNRVHSGKVLDFDRKNTTYRVKFENRDDVDVLSRTQVNRILMTPSDPSQSFDGSFDGSDRGKKRKSIKKKKKKKGRLRKLAEKKKKKKELSKKEKKQLRLAEKILKRRAVEKSLMANGLLFMEAQLSGEEDDDGYDENDVDGDLDRDLSGFIDDSTPTREKPEGTGGGGDEFLDNISAESQLSQNVYRKFVMDSPMMPGKKNRLRHLSRSKVCKSVYQSIGDTRIHHGYKCDECGADPICGVRYHCKTCGDVDYCETCATHSDNAELHVDHEFLQYSQVSNATQSQNDDGWSPKGIHRDPLRDVN